MDLEMCTRNGAGLIVAACKVLARSYGAHLQTDPARSLNLGGVDILEPGSREINELEPPIKTGARLVGIVSSLMGCSDASYPGLSLEGWPYYYPLGPWHDHTPVQPYYEPVPITPVVAAQLAEYPGAMSIAATRGAIHIAPLPGHSVSQFQYNLDAPPGTY
uniref:Uncharacterized protein n=1 Tax=Anopheles culicifacies TaxID=139723 RepID=A0A182LTQ9_9DIPT